MSALSKVVILTLCKDNCILISQTLERLIQLGFKEVVICNCLTNEKERQLKNNLNSLKGITVHIFNHTFVDYSTARNTLFEYADKLYQDNRIYLLNDPGEMLEINDVNKFSIILKDVIDNNRIVFLKQVWMNPDNVISWYLPKILSSHQKQLKFKGYVHECLINPDNTYESKRTNEIIQSMDKKWITSTSNDSITRSLQEESKQYNTFYMNMLKKQLKELSSIPNKNKDDLQLYSRTLFYLGQTYHFSNDLINAYHFYNQRYALDYFLEEKFESAFRCADIARQLHSSKKVVCEWFEKALQLQQRVEVYISYIDYLLYSNSYSSRQNDLQKVSQLVQKCIQLGYPMNEILFVNETAYTQGRQTLYSMIKPTQQLLLC